MYIQKCVKGIAGASSDSDGITKESAEAVLTQNEGIVSNWWRQQGTITPEMVAQVLTEENLDRHVHDYDNYGFGTPFISLASGAVERDRIVRQNYAYSAVDTALMFATDNWSRPGALFFCWVPVGHIPAVTLVSIAEPVRDLNIYQRWSPYQLEGEVTAKVHIPANQIQRVEWWDATSSTKKPMETWVNPCYVEPEVLSNVRDLF
jgi:hypothetical protein